MPLEHEMAEPLAGHHFFLHQDNPSVGILRLDTKNDQRWLLVTRKSLLALSEACAKHAEELQEILMMSALGQKPTWRPNIRCPLFAKSVF